MKKRILYVSFEGAENKYPLNRDKEKTIIGRHKTCDIVIDSKEVSRKHVAIIQKFEHVYIENVSTSGPLYMEGKEVEYVELPSGARVSLGVHEIWWQDESSETQVFSAETAITRQSTLSNDDHEKTRPSDINVEPQQQELPVENIETPMEPQVSENFLVNPVESSEPEFKSQDSHDIAEDLGINLESNSQAGAGLLVAEESPEGSDLMPEVPVESASGVVATNNNSIVESTQSKTRLVGTKALPIMRVIRGDVVGREIKLEHGMEWVVGRGRQCHVQIDNQKISRQHFKIIKIGDAYRILDLGSAHGTKVNGVSVSDAPLKAFDTIQAGAYEAQFLLVDPEIKADIAGGALIPGVTQSNFGKVSSPSDHTQVASHLPVMSPQRSEYSFGEMPNFNFASAQAAGMASKTSNEKKGPISGVIVWFQDQPKPRQILLGLLALVLLAAAAMSMVDQPQLTEEQLLSQVSPVEEKTENRTPSSETKTEESAPTKEEPKASVDPVTEAKDISPEYSALSEEDKNKIQNLYAKAERAKHEKNWQVAFDATDEILKKVKKYKNSADIMLEAQTYLNDNLIGSVSNNLGDVQDAANENAEQITLLLEEGKKSLKDQRWEDAQASFAKVLNLDPNNEEATRGFTAAHAKDVNFMVDAPKELPVPTIDPNFEEIQKQKQVFEQVDKEFQEARVLVYQGKAAEALPVLKVIDAKVASKVTELQSGRLPASVGDEVSPDYRALQSKTAEALEAARAKLRSEYQVQMADAEQYIANKQYSLAKENYDRILNQAPAFDEVLEARKQLYAKIVIEAKNQYQEALIYESVGDLPNAIVGFEKSAKMLENVDDYTASEYLKKSNLKLQRLKRN